MAVYPVNSLGRISQFVFYGSKALVNFKTRGTQYDYRITKRMLFDHDNLRLKQFIESRQNTQTGMLNVEEFKKNMQNKFENNDSLIFSNDLRNMVRVAETDGDLSLLWNLVKKYNTQTNVVRFGSYSVGPEIMRLYYILKKPSEALQAVKDPEKTSVFNETSSLLVLLDLLFEDKMYNEILETFNLILDKQLSGHRFPTNLLTIMFAACYKLNTPEAHTKATNLKVMLNNNGVHCTVRATAFYAALCLQQNEPALAYESAAEIRKDTTLGKNIMLMALVKLKEYDRIIDLLNNILYSDTRNTVVLLSRETYDCIQEAFQNNDGEENYKIIKDLLEQFNVNKLLTTKSLDDLLCAEIKFKPKIAPYTPKSRFSM